MRKWRNWQTRTFEGRVVHTVRVQVPFSAPKKNRTPIGVLFFFCAKRAEPVPPFAVLRRSREMPTKSASKRNSSGNVSPLPSPQESPLVRSSSPVFRTKKEQVGNRLPALFSRKTGVTRTSVCGFACEMPTMSASKRNSGGNIFPLPTA